MSNVDLKRIRHLALDMDGTLYRGGTLFDFTRPFLERMDRLGIGYTFLTNNSSRSVKDYRKHLRQLGIEARADQLYTGALASMDYLRERWPEQRRLWILGTPSLQTEFAEAGFEIVQDEQEPQIVVVSFDTALTFERLCKTAWWIKQGKPFIATHPDRVCPTDQPTVLVDCGAICTCLESATGQAPLAVFGKPDPRMLTGILQRHGLSSEQLAMVGDRTYTDMAMAHRAGALGVLVLTGETTAEQAENCPERPDLILPSIRELGELLELAKQG